MQKPISHDWKENRVKKLSYLICLLFSKHNINKLKLQIYKKKRKTSDIFILHQSTNIVFSNNFDLIVILNGNIVVEVFIIIAKLFIELQNCPFRLLVNAGFYKNLSSLKLFMSFSLNIFNGIFQSNNFYKLNNNNVYKSLLKCYNKSWIFYHIYW